MNIEKELQVDWVVANQQYLSAVLDVIKSQLIRYRDLTAEERAEKGSHEYLLAIEELKKEASNMSAPPAIEQLVDTLGLSGFERDMLLLCAGAELDSSIAEVVKSLNGDLTPLPSFSLALTVLPGSHWGAIAPDGPLRYWRLIDINKMQLLTRSPLQIDEHVLHYLTGVGGMHEKLREVLRKENGSYDLLQSQIKLAEEIFHVIVDKRKKYSSLPIVQLLGADRFDKLAIASTLCFRLGLELHTINVNMMPGNQHDLYELARLWNREAALNRYALFIDCDSSEAQDRSKTSLIADFIENIYGLVIFSGDWSLSLNKLKCIFDVKKPSSSEQLILWQQLTGAALDDPALQNLVSQFSLGGDAITKISGEISHSKLDGSGLNGEGKKLWRLCRDYTRPAIDELADRIEPMADWNDIVLPDEQKKLLKAIVSQVRYRSKVYERWGLAKKISRGLGISVLFAGESGTGKTMAAEVLANDLRLDLYKIDLSKVVNKYIGETEKSLKKIFDAAEDGGAILLFDEADALFGKRSEVKDSHDRYSNIEVSYLLQRMESYRGLAILTTNMRSSLDKAFLRRIRFVVQFPFPDAELRTKIWEKMFPEEVKHKLDMERLSRLSLPGGSIRNIALNAAFFAAGDGDEILMSHISQAAKAEYDKLEKTFSNSELKG